MADDGESPTPFHRERNLSNRNFRRNNRRRVSTDSFTSIDSNSNSNTNATTQKTADSTPSPSSTSTSSLPFSYAVNSESLNAFNFKSIRKMLPAATTAETADNETATETQSQIDDPSLLDVKQKVQHFETLQTDERIIFKIGKFHTKTNLTTSTPNLSSMRLLSTSGANNSFDATHRTSIMNTTSIDEVRSEDEVDEFSDYVEDEADGGDTNGNSEVVAETEEVKKIAAKIGVETVDFISLKDIDFNELSVDDFGKIENMRRSAGYATMPKPSTKHSNGEGSDVTESTPVVNDAKDFPRNYRLKPRPKTAIINTTNPRIITKYNSLYEANNDEVTEEEEEAELRNKSDKFIQPILEELIKTEETYVENLFKGIENYGNIFERKDLPIGLRGKKYVLLGNIESIAEFHHDEFLPMLHRNRRDLKRLFDEFQLFIDQNCFYGYVIFTMNKQRSLKLCDAYKNYFKHIQAELDDKLGINSFLVQPIQRMARYPLLLQQFITTLFKNRDFVMKPVIETCCRLEKKVRTLLTTTNESEVINDIVDCNEFNVFYQGRFRKVSEFNVFDHTLKRSYRSKVFIFDKCIIYTEIKGKNLVFHGRYPCEHIGIVAKTKSFTLFYERRKQQECDFIGEPLLIETWLELIRDMVNTYVAEERLKLHDRYSRDNESLHRKPVNLSLYRDSNRFSTDSGIGNIWVMPKPEAELDAIGNRTTWYATS